MESAFDGKVIFFLSAGFSIATFDHQMVPGRNCKLWASKQQLFEWYVGGWVWRMMIIMGPQNGASWSSAATSSEFRGGAWLKMVDPKLDAWMAIALYLWASVGDHARNSMMTSVLRDSLGRCSKCIQMLHLPSKLIQAVRSVHDSQGFWH